MPHFPPFFALVPLDGRPVCYDLPQQLAAIAGLSLAIPPQNLLGQLKQPADIPTLESWVRQQFATKEAVWLLAMDTLVYGGLIPSRQGKEPLEDLFQRFSQWKSLFTDKTCHGFASILRIPAYNNAQEEPDYWALYGERLHEFSVTLHRDGMVTPELLKTIPRSVWEHFLNTRQRNRTLLEVFLHHTAVVESIEGVKPFLQSLVLCEDDTGPWGLNRLEAEQLSQQAYRQGLTVRRQTGADEVASTLMTRTVIDSQPPKVGIVYTQPHGAQTLLKFDGLTAETLMHQQLAACGIRDISTIEEANIVLWCHTPPPAAENTPVHGDHCHTKPVTSRNWEDLVAKKCNTLAEMEKPIMIADVAYANGSDPALLAALKQSAFAPEKNFYGYGGWNTPGNATGTALAMGLLRWWAVQHERFNKKAFAQAMLTRLVDDGLYQSHWRHTLPLEAVYNSSLAKELTSSMQPEIAQWTAWCGIPQAKVALSFPCQRRFEVAVHIHP